MSEGVGHLIRHLSSNRYLFNGHASTHWFVETSKY